MSRANSGNGSHPGFSEKRGREERLPKNTSRCRGGTGVWRGSSSFFIKNIIWNMYVIEWNYLKPEMLLHKSRGQGRTSGDLLSAGFFGTAEQRCQKGGESDDRKVTFRFRKTRSYVTWIGYGGRIRRLMAKPRKRVQFECVLPEFGKKINKTAKNRPIWRRWD